jgi:hypothetical protein
VTIHLRAIVLITQGLEFTQLNDDGQKFMVAYVNRSNYKTKVKYSSYEKRGGGGGGGGLVFVVLAN